MARQEKTASRRHGGTKGGTSAADKPRARTRVCAWMAAAAALLAAGTASAAPYAYPSALPKKDLSLRLENDGTHSSLLVSKNIAGTKANASVSGEWHFRALDGRDIVRPAAYGHNWNGAFYGGEQVRLKTRIELPEARPGDVFLGYYLHKAASARPWVGGEFAFQCGGNGQHASCTNCFKLLPLAAARENIRTQVPPASPAAATAAAPSAPEAGAAASGMERLLAEDLAGKTVKLEREAIMFSLDDLPGQRAVGRLAAGMDVQVAGEAAPGFAKVSFATSSGETYEGAAKTADLVPRHAPRLKLEDLAVTNRFVKPQGPDEAGFVAESEEVRHRAMLRVAEVPADLVPAPFEMRLCCVRRDGGKRQLPPSSWKTVPPHFDVGYALRLEEARAGDEYLCYVFCNYRGKTWASWPFGLRCGAGGDHGSCAECFEFLPEAEVASLLERIAAGGDAAALAGEGAPGAASFPAGKTVLGGDTTLYELKPLPRERPMGTLKAGAALYVMEDLEGAFVRVRFLLPGGKSREAAAKKSDLGASLPQD